MNDSRHGSPAAPLPAEALTSADPELWNVLADLHAWSMAHPCDCEALCECAEGRRASS